MLGIRQNKTKEYLKLLIKIADYFDKNGFPVDIETNKPLDHFTVDFDNRYRIHVERI